jgi:hypothetical protein
MSDQTWFEELAIQFDPVGSWAFVGLVTVALAAVLLAIPPDRTRVNGRQRLALVALRLVAFLALVACMLRPTLVSSRKARQQGTVIVLADASESMTVADGAGGRTRWDELTAALAAARQAADRLVARGGFEINAWTFDRELQPLEAAGGDLFPLGDWQPRATSGETAIGGAIEEAVRAAAGRQLAGVIVLSDGAQHAYPPRDIPPQTAARSLAELGTPLWSVTLGQQRGGGQGRDAAIANLAVGETVYLDNLLEVAGRVRLEGLAGQAATVVLLAENEAGAMEEVARTSVSTPGEAGEQPVRMAWTPRSLGERKLTLRVEPQEGEVVLTNNELSTYVTVVDGGLRVLYLEGALRVEQRFLRRALAASPDMQVDFRWLDSSRRDRWPVDLGRQLAGDYDVYLIGDLDAAALRPADLQAIVERVAAGAGIGLLGGFHAFEAGGWAGSALGPLVPFEPDPLARQKFDEPVRAGLHLPGPLQMVPDERFGGISILRLGADDQASRAVWEALPPLAGATKFGRLVPLAKPLAVTAAGQPLLVAREFGEGRVVAFAADSTWRWVMQGAADEHRRFWRQLVLWLARRDDADADSLWLRLAQRRLPPGTPLEFDAGISGPDGGARPDAVLEATVISPTGQSRPVRAVPTADGFSGTVAECVEPGDWKLVVRARRPGVAEPQERSARFTVFRQDLELANPRANPLLMRQLAEATSGGVRLPEELPGIFEELAERPAEYESREQWTRSLADPAVAWPALLVLATALIGEWYLRKKWGLV